MAGLRLENVALAEHGPTMSLHVQPGECLCVVGPASSGKSKLLKILSGQLPPDRGVVGGADLAPRPEKIERRTAKPQDVGRRRGDNLASAATLVLSSLNLWDVRQTPVAELSPCQAAACEMVEAFLSHAPLLVFDGQLDAVDAWTRRGALRLIHERLGAGASVVVATDHLELADQFDHVIVLKESRPQYSGSRDALLAQKGQRELLIESERTAGVRALVDPLLVTVARTDTGYKLTPGPGQEHTAKLLREGYGDVKFVVTDNRSLQDIILELL